MYRGFGDQYYGTRFADPHYFNADLDPSLPFNADPDPNPLIIEMTGIYDHWSIDPLGVHPQ